MKHRFPFALGLIASAIALPLIANGPVKASTITDIGTSIAQNVAQPKVKLVLSAQRKIVTNQGQENEAVSWEQLEGNISVQPGEVLRYTLNSQNSGERSAKNLVLTQPIPSQTQYIAESARANGAELTYSIDGGETFSVQPMITVTLPNGKEELQPAPAALYSHIRWNYGNQLKPMSSVRAVYEVAVK